MKGKSFNYFGIGFSRSGVDDPARIHVSGRSGRIWKPPLGSGRCASIQSGSRLAQGSVEVEGGFGSAVVGDSKGNVDT